MPARRSAELKLSAAETGCPASKALVPEIALDGSLVR